MNEHYLHLLFRLLIILIQLVKIPWSFHCIHHIYGVLDRGFDPLSGQTKDHEIGICCFSAKHAALRKNSKDCMARNQDNVSEWGDMPTRGLLFQ